MSENESNLPALPGRESPPEKTGAITMSNRGVQLRCLDDVYRIAKYICVSQFAPKGATPESVTVAILAGQEIGLPPMAAVQNIAVINGRPKIFGDVMLGLVRASGLLESFSEEAFGEAFTDSFGYRCAAKRKGGGECIEEFTVADAKQAALWGKQGPWMQYPKRMLKFRARGFALRDLFGDVLNGMSSVEEDYVIDVTPDQLAAAPKQQSKPASISDLTAKDAGNEPIVFPKQKKAEPEVKSSPAPVAKEPNPIYASLRRLMDISHISEADAVEYAKSCLAAKDDASVTHIEEIDADEAARWVASWSVVMSAIKLFSRGGK